MLHRVEIRLDAISCLVKAACEATKLLLCFAVAVLRQRSSKRELVSERGDLNARTVAGAS